MRIEIDAGAANDPNSHRWLDRILHRIEDEWHVWDTASQSNTDALFATSWILARGDQGQWVKGMLDESIDRDVWDSALHRRSVRVTTVPTAADELTPQNAVRLADEPLYILVENRVSDGAFVERIVKELDQSLHDLWNCDGEPIRVDSLGGKGQMPQEVTRRLRGKPYRPRLVAIVDSDRTAPNAAASREALRLQDTCNQNNLPCWVLAKREAENYLPLVLLSAQPSSRADHQQRVAAWERLTDDQKNFFDMKQGLRTASSGDDTRLFDGLSADDRAVLEDGFGSNLDKCWKLWNLPAKQELINRGQGDLEHGISLIRREV